MNIRRVCMVLLAAVLCGFIVDCRSGDNHVGVVTSEIQGFHVKTYVNDLRNIEVTIASDDQSTIVAVPKTAIGLQNQMGDAEYQCLKACRAIEDDDKRVQCIVLCPVTKFHVAIFRSVGARFNQ